ncbi:MAG TPA: TonB family protein [Candidatus Sulfotelmatobacter sp.]|jgi:TonB family protein|nr:TonB family protein [Candidatus Sulfotelmatobacter sp.]
MVIYARMNLHRLLLTLFFLPTFPSPIFSQVEDFNGPQQFVLGRHTFFDFGPPNDYYEIYLVKQTKEGSEVQRITLTPAANKCYAPAKTEFVEKTAPSSVKDLLGGTDPCKIPEKELKKEQKRKKRGLVFSGASVALQVRCGSATRIIRADILDRDWFAANPNTPKNTSWTIELLDRLDRLTGPTVMDKPAFGFVDPPGQATDLADPVAQQDLGSGKYDALFAAAPDKASVLFKESLITPPKPTVQLVRSSPARPTVFKLPAYPRLPILAHHEGSVSIGMDVDHQGNVSAIIIYQGSKLFEAAVRDAVKDWKFPPDPDANQVTATIEFKLNCHKDPNR